MKFRVFGRDQDGQTVEFEVDAECEEDALSFAYLSNLDVEHLERLDTDISAESAGVLPREATQATQLSSSQQPAPPMPNILPQPLEDPLMVLAYYLGWSVCLYPVIFFTHVYLAAVYFNWGYRLIPVYVACYPFLYMLWRITPSRNVNALYLRSFRYDRDTIKIRMALQAGLGEEFRLSGIRDPRRRWTRVFRYAVSTLFLFHYATPRYMNLEARSDWKARLWRTLGSCRCAVIDLSDLTSFVVEEIQLCHACLGLDRILFVGSSEKPAESWRADVCQILGCQHEEARIQVLIWDRDTDPEGTFSAEVRQFADNLPPGTPGCRPEGLPLVTPAMSKAEQALMKAGASSGDNNLESGVLLYGLEPSRTSFKLWSELLTGTVLACVFYFLGVAILPQSSPPWNLLWLALVVLLLLAESWAICVYLVDSGRARRWSAIGLLVFALGWPVFVAMSWPALQKIESAASMMVDSNNLKGLGLAMDAYHSENQSFPPAIGFGPKGHPVSWRILLLPYLLEPDEMSIYHDYRQNEPWDSPGNLRLLERMPRVFKLPRGKDIDPPGHTFYRVLMSHQKAKPQAAFTENDRVRLFEFKDGSSNTILVATAAESVPWTQPDEFRYDPQGPLPQLGSHRLGGCHVVMADGSVRFLSASLPEKTLRALITRDGGDNVEDR